MRQNPTQDREKLANCCTIPLLKEIGRSLLDRSRAKNEETYAPEVGGLRLYQTEPAAAPETSDASGKISSSQLRGVLAPVMAASKESPPGSTGDDDSAANTVSEPTTKGDEKTDASAVVSSAPDEKPDLGADVSSTPEEDTESASQRRSEAENKARSRGRGKRPEFRIHHTIHDRFQVESDITFDLRPRGPFESRRRFKLDMYLYLPFSLGINSSTFRAEDFFRHWTSYFRVRAPLYQQWRVLPPELLSFPSVEEYFSGHLSTHRRKRLGPRVIQDIKLFGNFLYTELKKLRSALPKKKRGRNADRARYLADELIHRVGLLWSFREHCLAPLRQQQYLVDEEVQRAFYLTDEYLSYRAELVLLRARDALPAHADQLGELLAREITYRHENGLLVLSEGEEQPVALESYTYRLGLLKKYLGEALFLRAVSDKKDVLYKNYAAAIGAGLAALFTGIVEHQRMQYLGGDGSGLRFSFLIALAVLAYIFKDRIKELSRDYFNSRLRERLPDQRFRLMHETVHPDGQKEDYNVGICTEYFRFIKEIPSDIAYLRSLGQTQHNDPVRREHVMHVARRFTFNLPSEQQRTLFPLLKNVVRLDVSPFLNKLDNPTMAVSYFDKNRHARTVIAPKVYHLNGIFRYETLFGPEGSLVKVDYERFRLVIDKNGIVRLETLVESGRLAYQEIPT